MPYRRFPKRASNSDLFESDPSKPPLGDWVTANVDGGARGNPGPSGYGVHMQRASGEVVVQLSQYLGHQTNNFAEYSALIAALEYAVENNITHLHAVSDSELLVKQMKGDYKVSSPALKLLFEKARTLSRKLQGFRIQHVRRELNKEADMLANRAMDSGTLAPGAPASAATQKPAPAVPKEWNGIVRGGIVEVLGGELPEGTMVKIRLRNDK